MGKNIKKVPGLYFLALTCIMFASCSQGTLNTTKVTYQSVRKATPVNDKIPDDAKIAVFYSITANGAITPIVVNKTKEIMIIDQTMSFFVDSNGESKSYYDPTIRTTSTTDISSTTTGASLNLGAVGNALGIGGSIGALLPGINIGGSGTSGTSTTNTTYFADMPRVSLAPNSQGAMSKSYIISDVGKHSLKNSLNSYFASSIDESLCRFSVCISYSLDGGDTFDKIVTDFYVNAQIIENVNQKGKVNAALRQIYNRKPEALSEQWWLLYFVNNLPSAYNIYDSRQQGIIYDYK